MGVTVLSDILDKNNSVKESEPDYSGGVHYESDEIPRILSRDEFFRLFA